MKNLFMFTLMSLILFSNAWSKDKKIVKLVTIEWPPYVSSKIEGKGWTSQVIKAAFESQGYKAKFVIVKGSSPWGQVLKMVKDGRFIGGYPAYYSEDRTASYFFSRSFGRGPLGFFKRKGEKIEFDGALESLKKYKIGIVKNYVNSETFDKADYLKKRAYKNDRTSLVMLNKKRVDLVLLDKLVTKHHLKFDPYLKAVKSNFEFIEPPLENKNLHIIFTKVGNKGKEFTAVFLKGLTEIRNNGEYEKILTKYNAN
ncbi:transporter substrate-binding domain-containing protein [Bacteriovoracales bacterium]|nr:transporter substrate-binding domain-containing protein [Bacteriovoracales bacterium]